MKDIWIIGFIGLCLNYSMLIVAVVTDIDEHHGIWVMLWLLFAWAWTIPILHIDKE